MQISSSFNISFHSCLVFSFSIGSIFHRAVDFDDMKEFIRDEEINQLQGVVIANIGDVDSLCDAFRGCNAIFHTSSFVDPHGVSMSIYPMGLI